VDIQIPTGEAVSKMEEALQEDVLVWDPPWSLV